MPETLVQLFKVMFSSSTETYTSSTRDYRESLSFNGIDISKWHPSVSVNLH